MRQLCHRILRPGSGWLAALCLAAGAACGAAAQEQNEVVKDDWEAVYFAGAKAGHLHLQTTRRTVNGEVRYVTRTTHDLLLSVSGIDIQLITQEEIAEDEHGKVLSFRHMEDQGGAVNTSSGEVADGKMTVMAGQPPYQEKFVFDAPDALGPYAFDRATIAKGFQEGTRYSLKLFLASQPEKGLQADATVGPQEAVEIFEVTKWLHRVTVVIPELAGVVTEMWIDDQCETWLTQQSVGGLVLEMRRVTKAQALSGEKQPAEVMLKFAVTPDQPIADPRTRESLTLLLKPRGNAPADRALPEDPYQTVKKVPEGLLVTIRKARPDPAANYPLPYKGAEFAGLLKPTPWLETQAPLIVQMAREAVADETDALRATLKIQSYVRNTIQTKRLGMGFATALETARQKAGDCTEHAVLAAALARAAGIPSRVVIGMGYAQAMAGAGANHFLYHMWAEVYVGKWYPIDAAMGDHDATHLALGRSNLDTPGAMMEVSSPVPLFLGSTDIEVVNE